MPLPLPENSAVAAVQLSGNDEELLVKKIEAITTSRHFQHAAHVPLQRIAVVQSRRQQVRQFPQDVGDGDVQRVRQ